MGGNSGWALLKLKPSPKNASKRTWTRGMRAKLYFRNDMRAPLGQKPNCSIGEAEPPLHSDNRHRAGRLAIARMQRHEFRDSPHMLQFFSMAERA
jgi:hypothetical protein